MAGNTAISATRDRRKAAVHQKLDSLEELLAVLLRNSLFHA